MERAYAQALLHMIQKGKSPEDAVRALHEALVRSGRASLLPKIARAFLRISSTEHTRDGVTITVARQSDADKALAAAHKHLEAIKADNKNIAVRLDDSLIGGWRLEGKEQLVDASYKKYLLEIYTHATHA